MSLLNFDKGDVAHAITRKLALDLRDGKERNGWYELDGKKILRVTIPHGRGALPPGTANAIRDQVKLTKEQLADLIRCPLKAKDYERIIREKMDSGLLD